MVRTLLAAALYAVGSRVLALLADLLDPEAPTWVLQEIED